MSHRRLVAFLVLASLFLPLGCNSNKSTPTDTGPGLAPGQKFDSPRKKTEN